MGSVSSTCALNIVGEYPLHFMRDIRLERTANGHMAASGRTRYHMSRNPSNIKHILNLLRTRKNLPTGDSRTLIMISAVDLG